MSAAVIVSSSFVSRGWQITTDSYISYVGGTNRTYDPSLSRDHGDIWAISNQTNSLDLGNPHIRGAIHTGPNSILTIGPGGAVGDSAWINAGNTGIEPGHLLQDGGLLTFPDATLPTLPVGKVWVNAVKGPYVISGVTYDYYLTSNNPWIINNLIGSIYVAGTNAPLQLTGTSATIPYGGSLHVGTNLDGTSSSLAVYVSAASFTFNATSSLNEGGIARNLQYYGLPANTSLVLARSGNFAAQIYAPEADVALGDGSATTSDFVGWIMAKSFRANVDMKLHCDESLFPAPIPASLAQVSVISNQFQVSITGTPGEYYVVQGSTNLTDWVSLQTNAPPFTFVDSAATNFMQRFYRAVYSQ